MCAQPNGRGRWWGVNSVTWLFPNKSAGLVQIPLFHGTWSIAHMIYHLIWLVVPTPLKDISQLELLFPIYTWDRMGKENMFQTTIQLSVHFPIRQEVF